MTHLQILLGDCREQMRTLADGSVQTCVTSPPYFGLRDYGHAGQLGLETTPDDFVAAMVEVFREVHRVLADDGTLWLNLGDSYGAAKQLLGIPWRVAFALQADGWYLRQDIIWHKPNPMPESVTDRCTKAHEYIFLFSKKPRYYFDAEAISQPLAESSKQRLAQPTLAQQTSSTRVPGKTNGNMKAVGPRFGGDKYGKNAGEEHRTKSGEEWKGRTGKANKRSVWTITTKPFKGAHFAAYPPDLIEPCVLAGSRVGDIVLDPFGGSGTTAGVAIKHGRNAVLCELNPEYAALVPDRIASIVGEGWDLV